MAKKVSRAVRFLMILGVALFHGLVIWLVVDGFKPGESSPYLASDTAGISFISNELFLQDEAWLELSELMDTAPLFLPTKQNFATAAVRIPRQDASGLSFDTFGPEITGELALGVEVAAKGSEEMEPFLDLTMPQWILTRERPVISGDEVRALSVVLRSASGEVLSRRALDGLGADDILIQEIWRPVRYSAAYDDVGLVGFARRMTTSGNADTDIRLNELANQIAREWVPRGAGWLDIIIAP